MKLKERIKLQQERCEFFENLVKKVNAKPEEFSESTKHLVLGKAQLHSFAMRQLLNQMDKEIIQQDKILASIIESLRGVRVASTSSGMAVSSAISGINLIREGDFHRLIKSPAVSTMADMAVDPNEECYRRLEALVDYGRMKGSEGCVKHVVEWLGCCPICKEKHIAVFSKSFFSTEFNLADKARCGNCGLEGEIDIVSGDACIAWSDTL